MSYITDVVFITSMYGAKAGADAATFQKIWANYNLERYDRVAEPLTSLDSAGPKWPSLILYHVTFNYGPLSEIVAHDWLSEDTAIYIDHEEEPYQHYVIQGGTSDRTA